MTIVYLDVDDEITSAAARIRTAEEVDVALVLPAGSRIATGRINFRLLAREASSRSRRLAIVAPEASTRALAASAGLPVFASVMEYDEARGRPDGMLAVPPAPIAAAALPAADRAPGGAPLPANDRSPVPPRRDADPTLVREGGRPKAAVGASTGLSAGRTAAPPRRRRWPLVIALLVGVALLVGTGAAVGYVFLPTATITLRLATELVGPVVFTGTSDPDAGAVDASTATIPAARITLPLSATGTFKATGKRVERAAAKGRARWTNCDYLRSYRVPNRSIVRTSGGIAFSTTEDLLLPNATFTGGQGGTVTCSTRVGDIVAVEPGTAGNVPAGAITVIPGTLDARAISVRNPAPTSGGLREEFPKVVEKDVTAAVAALTAQLDEELAGVASSPPGMAAGTTAYPETARRGEPAPSEPVADIVGREVGSFDLTLTADGSVVAADPTPLEAIGAARIAADVPEGMQAREGSVRVEVGPGVVDGETIRYPVEARAEAVRDIGAEEVRGLVRGKTPVDARALLADYGTVEIVVWPDWFSTITTIDARLEITVEGVPPAEPTPVPSTTSTPTAPTATSPPPHQGGSPSASAAP